MKQINTNKFGGKMKNLIVSLIGCFFDLFRKPEQIYLSDADQKFLELYAKVERSVQKKKEQEAEWLKNNPPVIYYNEVGGIVSLLREEYYEELLQQRDLDAIDAKKSNDSVLDLNANYLFLIDKEAFEEKQFENRKTIWHFVSSYQDLIPILEKDCKLIKDDKIFVPFVNETLLSYTEQMEAVSVNYQNDPINRRSGAPPGFVTTLLTYKKSQ